MKYDKIIYIVKTKLHYYPPCVSQIRSLNKLGIEVKVFYGTSNESALNVLKNEGIEYKKVGNLIEKDNKSKVEKIKEWYTFRKALLKALKQENLDNTLLWFGTAETVLPLKGKLKKFKYIVSLLELYDESKLKIRLLEKIVKNAKAITVCEKNRGYIMKNWWNLKKLPYIFPNKPYSQDRTKRIKPTCEKTEKIIKELKNKEFVLYQGILQNTDELLSLAHALKKYNKDYFLVLMGIDKYNGVKKIKEIYPKTIYIEYVPAPLHLEITSYAKIGIAYYRDDSLNKIYCAPNKIYEYSGFGIPIICNDVPGLENTVGRNNAGICIKLESDNIVKALEKIDNNYVYYSKNATKMFEDTDNLTTMNELINDLKIKRNNNE